MRTGSEDFNSLYPEPPQGVFPSPPLSIQQQHMSPDSYFQTPQPDCYPAASVAFNNSNVLYAAETPFSGIFGDHMSPAMFTEETEMRVPSSSLSTASGPSAPSSAVGSPRSNHDQPPTIQEWPTPQCMSVTPGIVGQGEFFTPGEYSYSNSHMDELTPFEYQQPKSFLEDPSILHPEVRPLGIPTFDAYPPQNPQSAFGPSAGNSPELKAGSISPYPPSASTYPQFSSPFLAPTPLGDQDGCTSRASFSGFSASEQQFSDGEGKEKQRCPHPDCGKRYKDLRAHMLTHQTERPEKCPIQTCEYHIKGFARKYDKNRHTLTHYKGTMVCGFCPGSGSPAEKSFNRADVFKRHLTAVHGVEQTPPNSRKKTSSTASVNGTPKLGTYAPDATGKCSTCSQTFSNAQEFYEHLDDCVLRIVQQEDPAEAVNASRLAEVANDQDLHVTLEKNQVPVGAEEEDDENMVEEEEAADAETPGDAKNDLGSPRKLKGNPINGVQKSRGMTHSRGGVPFMGKSRSRRSRQNYPTSWGFDKGQMTMRKRVMTVFEGPRRLAKDDMMLSTEHEVRLKLSDGKAYVTDLDVQTMKRAEGFHHASDEEKGPWISDDPTEEQLKQMQAM